jgi:hypothetical protein
MPIEQQYLLGASISSYSLNLGWNTNSSTLSVNLVEDPATSGVGGYFTPFHDDAPQVGEPIYFNHTDGTDTFEYGGLLQSWEQSNSQGGKPLYRVTITDAREILEGTQIIIGDYNGHIKSVPNLFNVYGYLENNQFGSAHVTEAGMPVKIILDTVSVLSSAVPSIAPNYGGPIKWRGVFYGLDLTELPKPPFYYRIGGSSVSLLDIINQLCEEAGVDWYINLVDTIGFGPIIKFKTVSRVGQPPMGQIAAFIGDGTNNVANTRGHESRIDITSAFVAGGNVSVLYPAQAPASGSNISPQNQTIWPFWGLNQSGIPIIGNAPGITTGPENFMNDSHKFVMNTTMINVIGVTDSYNCDVGEIRAALAGEAAWVGYVAANKPTVANSMGLFTDMKILQPLLDLIKQDKGKPTDFINTSVRQGNFKNAPDRIANVRTMFRFVQGFAQEYYGRKFMVRIPFLLGALEDDTQNLIISHQPTDGGYLEEGAQPLGLPVFFEDLFQTQDGRFQAFVRYNNAFDIDFSNLSPNDYVVWSNNLYLKCELDPNVYFMDNNTLDSPRVVITLPNVVNRKGLISTDRLTPNQQAIAQQAAAQLRAVNPNDANLGPDGKLNLVGKNRIKAVTDKAIDAEVNYGMGPYALMPNMAAVPLISNVLTYGPWYTIGPSAKTYFEKDDTLVPWNYGGYTELNKAGLAKVYSFVTNMVRGELGTVTVPGIPLIPIGQVLKIGGPNITGIDVEIGEQGITTTYSMRTYTPRYGAFSRANVDRIKRLIKTNQQFKRSMKQLWRQNLYSRIKQGRSF